GGISGLAAAYALRRHATEAGLSLDCTVLEAAPGWGGKIVTHRVGDLIMEAGPDSFLSQKPWALQLCEQLGLADQLINTNPTEKKAFVFSRGRLHELPEGLVTFVPHQLGPFVRSGLLSWRGLARMGLDLVIPKRRGDGDESLASFFRRRFGREAFERVMEPLMAGIYAGDAEQMSLRASFPRFYDLEQRYGSVLRGMMAARKARMQAGNGSAAGRTMFVTLRNGLGDLTSALVDHLQKDGVTLKPSMRAAALRVRSHQLGRWMYDVIVDDGTAMAADGLIVAIPAYGAADLVRPLSPAAAGLLEQIPYASTATVSLVYDAHEMRTRLEGSGFVVPRIEGRELLAATWTSLKWPHRASSRDVSIRCYVGGVGREAVLRRDDDSLVGCIREELRAMAGITAMPRYVEVNRWERAMPQYLLGHVDHVGRIDAAMSRFSGLALAGAAYRGVGIPDCIKDGTAAATALIEHLRRPAV
ncbi:MAG TPA: protoporphyrinogen oxidase, partial [Nitrospiraceae bacterium]|nr:protoporphyrinogen oxidase [Nitrospiraceae bacterium]